jgi:hypothetical protein
METPSVTSLEEDGQQTDAFELVGVLEETKQVLLLVSFGHGGEDRRGALTDARSTGLRQGAALRDRSPRFFINGRLEGARLTRWTLPFIN